MYLVEKLAVDELYVEENGRLYFRCQACGEAVHGCYNVTPSGTYHVKCDPENDSTPET